MLLLDTCALIWYSAGKSDLSEKAGTAIRENPDEVFVSAASALEIGIKVKSGKLGFALPPEKWYQQALEAFSIREIPVDARISFEAAALPAVHNDPFDRLIIATARLNRLTVVTSDQVFHRYKDIKVLW